MDNGGQADVATSPGPSTTRDNMIGTDHKQVVDYFSTSVHTIDYEYIHIYSIANNERNFSLVSSGPLFTTVYHVHVNSMILRCVK